MSAHRTTLALGAVLLSLGLTACGGAGISVGSDGVSVSDGQGAGVSAGPDGVSASHGEGTTVAAGADGVTASGGDGASVSVGADGAQASDGDGSSVSIGADGATVSGGGGTVVAGSDGSVLADGSDGSVVVDGSDGSVVAGSGAAGDSAAGVAADVVLAGALTFRGTATGACQADGGDRAVQVRVGSSHELQLEVSDGDVAIALDGADREWGAVYGAGASAKVVTVTAGRTVVRGARLVAEDGSVVRVDGVFPC